MPNFPNVPNVPNIPIDLAVDLRVRVYKVLSPTY